MENKNVVKKSEIHGALEWAGSWDFAIPILFLCVLPGIIISLPKWYVDDLNLQIFLSLFGLAFITFSLWLMLLREKSKESVGVNEMAVLARMGTPVNVFIWPGNYRISPFHKFVKIPWVYAPLIVETKPITNQGTLMRLVFSIDIEPYDALELIKWTTTTKGVDQSKLHQQIEALVKNLSVSTCKGLTTEELWSIQNDQEVFADRFEKIAGGHKDLTPDNHSLLFERVGCKLTFSVLEIDTQQSQDRAVLSKKFREVTERKGEQAGIMVRVETLQQVIEKLKDNHVFSSLEPKDQQHIAILLLDMYGEKTLTAHRFEAGSPVLDVATMLTNLLLSKDKK